MDKKTGLHIGTYIFGDVRSNSTCGGVFGTIKIPEYSSTVLLFINSSHENQSTEFENARAYNFNLQELESMHKALERLVNDMRKMESLARKDLLRDEAYMKTPI